MSGTTFTAEIRGAEIHCEITSERDLSAPVFCFSLMAPPAAVSGGTLVRSDGSYGEVQLPSLSADVAHRFVLRYAHPDYTPVNRAWLPLGAYLRSEGNIVELPKLPAGVADGIMPSLPRAEGLCLIPQPKSWRPNEGTLSLQSIEPQSHLWDGLEALARRCKLPPLQANGGVSANLAEDRALTPEGYRIAITPTGIEVTCGGPIGAHYAGVTLLVLRQIHDGQLPCGVIEDEPRFEWRGQHLDCARHFYEIGSITRLIDLMALLKMNRFHWHFSDDEAFRLELRSVPELSRETGERGENQLVPGVFGGGSRSGGTYSQKDAQMVINHARDLFIEVLPEIEFPAHALAFARAFPETRDREDQGDETSVQGYARNVLNPALPETWRIVEAIAEEVSALFPSGILHLGADELPPGTWEGSPAVARLKQEEDLETSDDVLGWALHRLARQLAKKGVRSAAWEEAARGKNGGI